MDDLGHTLSPTPPCARYEGGENNDRLIRVWIYAAGLAGGGQKAAALGEKIARLYDYKGELVIATREDLSPDERSLFGRAWAEIGSEPAENVEFCDVRSETWERLWGAHRFASDWQP